MIGTILTVCAVAGAINALGKVGDTRVRHGKNIFGERYRTEDGPCYRCDGTGEVHGHTCRKCGGSGWYHKRTWYS